MNPLSTLNELVERLGPRLLLRWLTLPPNPPVPLGADKGSPAAQSLVGPLNCIRPNRLQVIGEAEQRYLAELEPSARRETMNRLFASRPAAVLFANGIEPEPGLLTETQRLDTPLLASPLPDDELIGYIQYYLTLELAPRVIIHGVFMEVLGTGVLLVGDPAVGKSELALELINRGQRLIADDAPEFANIAPEMLEGFCPPLLRDFLEVRGLGILNIRAMFGESAVRQRKRLNLIVNLRTLDAAGLLRLDRLGGPQSARTILGVNIPEVTMPVAPGRNLAILVEAAVRSQVQRSRGYDAGADFTERQARALQGLPPAGDPEWP
jgi:HPr kinase/phosphorylase